MHCAGKALCRQKMNCLDEHLPGGKAIDPILPVFEAGCFEAKTFDKNRGTDKIRHEQIVYNIEILFFCIFYADKT